MFQFFLSFVFLLICFHFSFKKKEHIFVKLFKIALFSHLYYPKGEQQSEKASQFANKKTLEFPFFISASYHWFKYLSTRKLTKSLKNVGGNLTHFCLGPKTEISCWALRFSVRSKILAFCGTLLREVLILVPKQNCARKSLCHNLASLTNHTS